MKIDELRVRDSDGSYVDYKIIDHVEKAGKQYVVLSSDRQMNDFIILGAEKKKEHVVSMDKEKATQENILKIALDLMKKE